MCLRNGGDGFSDIFFVLLCVCIFVCVCVCVFLYVGDSKSERALERVSSENILLCVYYVVTIIVFHRLATFVLQVLLQLGDRD